MSLSVFKLAECHICMACENVSSLWSSLSCAQVVPSELASQWDAGSQRELGGSVSEVD